jgi:hypothetical protein
VRKEVLSQLLFGGQGRRGQVVGCVEVVVTGAGTDSAYLNAPADASRASVADRATRHAGSG